MSTRTLTQLAVVALAVVAVALGTVLAARELNLTTSAGPADAGPCDLTAMPTALSPNGEDSVLLLSADKGVAVTLDGKKVTSLVDDPQSFPVGEHVVRAVCEGKSPIEQKLELFAFTPAAVHAGCGQLSAFGASCDGCPPLAEARKAAAKAGKASGVFAASAAQEKLELRERPRARTVLINRWNAVTERYSRVLLAVGREAPGPSASANQRIEELSLGFKEATNANDPLRQDQTIRTTEETLRAFVRAARLAHPSDCAYQRSLTDSF